MSQAPLVIVGGTSLFRRGLCSFLEDTPFELVAEYDDAEACVADLDKVQEADIVIYVSNGDPELSASAVDALRSCLDARLMVLSGELSVDELGACLRAGAVDEGPVVCPAQADDHAPRFGVVRRRGGQQAEGDDETASFHAFPFLDWVIHK